MKQTERAGGKTSFPCQMYSLACLICLNVLSPPCIKAKIDPVWKKFSKSRTGREMEDREFAVFWIRKTGNQAAAGPLPLACTVIFCISSLRPMKKISVFPKHLENAGYFSRVKSCYHKLFIFDPSSWQYPNKNNCFSFYLPSINCQVWKIPTLFFSPQNFSRPARQSHLLSLADNPVHCSIKLIAI